MDASCSLHGGIHLLKSWLTRCRGSRRTQGNTLPLLGHLPPTLPPAPTRTHTRATCARAHSLTHTHSEAHNKPSSYLRSVHPFPPPLPPYLQSPSNYNRAEDAQRTRTHVYVRVRTRLRLRRHAASRLGACARARTHSPFEWRSAARALTRMCLHRGDAPLYARTCNSSLNVPLVHAPV